MFGYRALAETWALPLCICQDDLRPLGFRHCGTQVERPQSQWEVASPLFQVFYSGTPQTPICS
jgi:hypothetical protein